MRIERERKRREGEEEREGRRGSEEVVGKGIGRGEGRGASTSLNNNSTGCNGQRNDNRTIWQELAVGIMMVPALVLIYGREKSSLF